MSSLEVRKQISLFLPLSEWRALREEAARNRIPITELCRRWMNPEMEKLLARLDAGAVTSQRTVRTG